MCNWCQLYCGCSVAKSHLTLCYAVDCSQAPLSMDCPGKNTGVVSFRAPEGLPNPGTVSTFLASPALADGFVTTEPPGNPINSLRAEL